MALAVRKLQSVIVDALEDVKAQDIRVFDTEHLSALFERVIVASGTSNRQTRSLAASVRDAVKAAGGPQPRTEGEENGEWIIVDCGPAVVHVMQPAIRAYYHLEELWGEKPVKSKAAARKTALPKATPAGTATAGRAPVKRAGGADVPPRGAPAQRATATIASPTSATAKRPTAKRPKATGATATGATASGATATSATAKRAPVQRATATARRRRARRPSACRRALAAPRARP